MLANRTSRWSLGAGLLCAVILAASWFLLISPRRADASGVRAQAAQVDSQAAQLQITINQLKSDFADLSDRKKELKAIRAELPPGGDVPTLVRHLQTIAAQSGVSLDSIAPGTPSIVAAAGTAATTTVAGAGTLVTIPMGLVVTGDYFEAELFLKNLQTKDKRAFLISGLTVAPAPETVVATTSAAVTTTATGTATPTATATPVTPATTTAALPNLDRVSITIPGAVFVLLDGTVTLDDVKAQAKAAATTTTKSTTTATTAAGTPVTAGTAATS